MIDKKSMVPVYFQIMEDLKSKMRSGTITVSMKIPSESEMVSMYGVGRLTIRNALTKLAAEGLIKTIKGKGSYCISLPESGSNRRVAVLINMSDNYFFQYYLQGITDALNEKNIAFRLYDTKGQEEQIYALVLQQDLKAVDGIILQPSLIYNSISGETEKILNTYEASGIPIMQIDCYYVKSPRLSYVICNDRLGGELAAQHFMKLGCTKTIYIHRPEFSDSHLRKDGFVKKAQELKMEVPIIIEHADNYQELLNNKLNLRDKIGIFCYNDELAVLYLRALKQMHIQVPKEVSVISYDDSVIAQSTEPPLTSVGHPKQLLGRMAANALSDILDHSCLAPFKYIFLPELVERASTSAV